ncbi:hypothetical protein [Brevundimonas sp.]|uniref:hypothetical protein n=1 Tax=Brevundimonas sp. TaxID=1871086 RepID=UPI0027312610|nr:hypothetical protein [Brevundimonas sp.]MDP1912390.1 hypothetical protein [Brevundimonas sp.]
MPAEDPDAIAARLLEALEGLDLTSADGRAGINTLLSEIERACPGAILQQAAGIELRAVGLGKGDRINRLIRHHAAADLLRWIVVAPLTLRRYSSIGWLMP